MTPRSLGRGAPARSQEGIEVLKSPTTSQRQFFLVFSVSPFLWQYKEREEELPSEVLVVSC